MSSSQKKMSVCQCFLFGGIFIFLICSFFTTSREMMMGHPLFLISETKQQSQQQLRYCTRDEIRDGQWVPAILPKAPYVPTTIEVRQCYEDSLFNDSKPWKSWDWQPHNTTDDCLFEPWNATEFCTIISERSISTMALIGDSLTFEQYQSLVQLLGLPADENHQHQSRRKNRNHVQYACNKTLKLIYRRSDDLMLVPDVLRAEAELPPQVLILNKGAHYQEDKAYQEGWIQTLETLEGWQDNCISIHGKNCLLLVRTTVPGHPYCGTFSEPVNDITAMEALVADNPSSFFWWEFKKQNEWMLNLFTTQEDKQHSLDPSLYRIIDAYDFNMRRPDLHRAPDCLHSCHPGKMDVYNQVFLHYLKESAQQPGT